MNEHVEIFNSITMDVFPCQVCNHLVSTNTHLNHIECETCNATYTRITTIGGKEGWELMTPGGKEIVINIKGWPGDIHDIASMFKNHNAAIEFFETRLKCKVIAVTRYEVNHNYKVITARVMILPPGINHG